VAEAVVFDRVWKKFRRGERHDSVRDLVPAVVRRVFSREASPELESRQDFWALKDVSFTVEPSEALGIIGPNGAGKSTALKLLTRILRPTHGACRVRGRVGALIEVAAGFHPDLTGRENIFLQGAIMGMKRAEIARKLDSIVEFAGVLPFIDTPVKRYSSGMNARLGFSIAAHLDPEVLIIDEVLSVGDMEFQERCIKRMLEFKREGVAIVFVSHNLQAIELLCERALFIRNEVIALADTRSVLEHYVQHVQQAVPSQADGDFMIKEASLRSALGRSHHVPPGTPMVLSVTVEPRRDARDVTFAFIVHRSTDMLAVYNGNFTARELGIQDLHAGEQILLEFRFNANLVRGLYHAECAVVDAPTQTMISSTLPPASFSVLESRTWAGVADLSVTAVTLNEDSIEVGSAGRKTFPVP
jgi:homopolymeric O-antigen transport system ATP-binding protein